MQLASQASILTILLLKKTFFSSNPDLFTRMTQGDANLYRNPTLKDRHVLVIGSNALSFMIDWF